MSHVRELSVYPCLEKGGFVGHTRFMLQVEGFSVGTQWHLHQSCVRSGPCLLLPLAKTFFTDVLVQCRLTEFSFQIRFRVVMP